MLLMKIVFQLNYNKIIKLLKIINKEKVLHHYHYHQLHLNIMNKSKTTEFSRNK